jgi:hypothetical protein
MTTSSDNEKTSEAPIARYDVYDDQGREGVAMQEADGTYVTYADHCKAIAEVWQEAHDLLAREGWDMSREKILEYFAEQAKEAAHQEPVAAPEKGERGKES